ncbi:serine/threonine-protein kinase [Polyangium aurulentum]|uniref:serine/threonine-protein kinase n=1 Tax=Polyangium aurulentum TaxID=2567896 RepID=UPI0010ADFAA9|nr:serine/threonine-protein kinase [Polyangium aurulentum]UQA60912.1 protein kinase [Polyangium aurulentum]
MADEAPREGIVDVEATTVPALDLALRSTEAAGSSGRSSERASVPPALAERYEDICFLGEGGMGTVYRGRDPRLGRTVALKLLKGSDPALLRRFLQEARSQAKIQHEHVCRVYEAGEADGEPFIVMQYIEGEPLSRMGARLTLEQRVKLMREVSAAVHEAHRLGLIHRDIKPGNILVEASADGDWKPYVMDFGLARDVADRGETVTGAVLGTPAYMSPEQAKGDVRAMDRRSDVYSLGATLFDLLAGRPPFVAPHAWKLVMKVAFEEPPPLRSVKKGLPEDLETIVMKCLERDPGRRYDSARALAEDLQRFLDGDPIRARRASFGYVVWKKARKHKAATALGGVVLVAALALSGVWVKGRQEAAAGARIAQELGERVKEMELFLRAAYELPLHDVERERDVVRRRLSAIEQRMKEAGRAGEGPGHYALGRGYLALGDPALAREHLQKAVAAGYSAPELAYAMGRTLGELYRRALEETKRITNEEQRKKREAELSAELRDPALSQLRAAAGAEIEAPAYVEGLIALYEGRNEEARAKAREAFEQAPWMYEAKKLEADALFAEGSKYRHDAAFDWEKMKSYFEPAAEAYKVAAEMAESDPEVYRAECELWEKMGLAAAEKGTSAKAAMDAADGACARAVQASSRDGRARVQRALVMSARTFAVRGEAGEDAVRVAEAAVRAAEESVRTSPGDVMANYALARALHHHSKLLVSMGQDISMEPAITAYQRVLELDPNFTWAVNELGQVYLAAARAAHARGQEGRELSKGALRQFDRALELDPSFASPIYSKLELLGAVVEHEIEHGKAAEAPVAELFESIVQLEQRNTVGAWRVAYWKARALGSRALQEFALARDPRPSIDAALETIRAFAGEQPRDYYFLMEMAVCRYLAALYAVQERLDPSPHLDEARRATREAAKIRGAVSIDWRTEVAKIEVVALRAALQRGKLRVEDFEAALAPLNPVLSEEHTDPRPYQVMAEILAFRAAWAQDCGRAPQKDVAAGLLMAEKALSKNPHMATAIAAKGRLHLVQARAARTHPERAEAARRAKEAFASAFQENPTLAREHGDALREAAALL